MFLREFSLPYTLGRNLENNNLGGSVPVDIEQRLKDGLLSLRYTLSLKWSKYYFTKIMFGTYSRSE